MKAFGNRSSLFLTELVLDLFMFIVCSAVCSGLLVYAYSMGQESTRLSQAVYQAQTAAEAWQGGAIAPDNNTYELHFDKNWALDESSPGYTLTLKEQSESGGVTTCDISVSDSSGDVIFLLSASKRKGAVIR